MCRKLINLMPSATAANIHAALILAVSIAALAGCRLIDLRPIRISTVPGSAWAILPEADSHIMVCFDTEMEKPAAENALQIFSPMGMAEGEYSWAGNSLHFVPSIPWMPGLRYALKLSGTVVAVDGRELTLSRDIPFYAVSRSALPYVRSFFPPDGLSVGVSPDSVLELDFSLPMDRRAAENAIKLEVPGSKFFEWHDDDRKLRVSSDRPLDPWVIYRWSVSDTALSREGAPLAKEVSGRFISDLDREFISVARLVPLLPPAGIPGPESALELWGGWFPAGPGLEQGPGHGQGIGVEFSKAFDNESLSRAFSFTPALPGRVEILSPTSAVYVPAKDPEPETVYRMRISGSLKDSGGLKMGEDYSTSFRTDLPYLRVSSVSSPDTKEPFDSAGGGVFTVPVNSGGRIRIILHFSLMFDSEDPSAREESVFKISFRPFFPISLLPVSLRTALWISSDQLFLEWEGAEAGLPSEPHYYRLNIPGGSAGVQNGMGSYLKEDLVLYLEAVP